MLIDNVRELVCTVCSVRVLFFSTPYHRSPCNLYLNSSVLTLIFTALLWVSVPAYVINNNYVILLVQVV